MTGRVEAPFADLPPIPEQLITFDGQQVDTSQAVWEMSVTADGGGRLTINWRLLDEVTVTSEGLYGRRARYLVKLYLADRLTQRMAGTVATDYTMFLMFGRWLGNRLALARSDRNVPFEWVQFSPELAADYLDWCMKRTGVKGNAFSRLRHFYRWGIARRFLDFDSDTFRILKVLKTSRSASGHYVRFRDRLRGPFSPEEKRLLIQAIQAGAGTAEDRAIVMLHLELGTNPLSLLRLRNDDFKHIESDQGVFYQLDVPRVKKRVPQRETRRRPLSQRLGKLLENLQQGKPTDSLLHWLSQSHPQQGLRAAMQRWAAAADIVSPRTGQLLHLNPRRFRYTLATHLAEEGASRFHIADVLDHTDLSNVDVYVETTSSIAEQVAQATDDALAPVVNRFLGKMVDGPPQAAGGPVVPAAIPHLPLLNAGGIGVCGRDVVQEGLCQLFPPLSCYLCPSFAALRSGPHRDIHEAINAFIESGRNHVDERILRQLDDVRSAIREVLDSVEGRPSLPGGHR